VRSNVNPEETGNKDETPSPVLSSASLLLSGRPRLGSQLLSAGCLGVRTEVNIVKAPVCGYL